MKTGELTDLRILLLEDSDLDAELILHELARQGIFFVSRRAQNRSEFARAIQEFEPEIILADYQLPTFNGGEALIIAQECCPEVPVIMVSGAVGEEAAVKLLKDGATDFVLKHRLNTHLVPALHRVLREMGERQARKQTEAALRRLNAQLEQRVAERTSELAAKNALMEADLELARELQMTFVPKSFPTIPPGASSATSAVKFSSIFHPVSAVSSDYYNVVPVSDTSVGIFICDVMGHGVRAALVTAMLHTLEKQLGSMASDPGSLLTEMNHGMRRILGQLGTTLFTTVCYVIVDVANARLTFANAGHPSPMILRESTDEIEMLNAEIPAGPALGLLDDTQYFTHEISLEERDQVFLFTNGLFLAQNATSEVFGINRLQESITRRSALPLVKLLQDVFSEVENFTSGQGFCDDICLVGLEISHLKGPGQKYPAQAKKSAKAKKTSK